MDHLAQFIHNVRSDSRLMTYNQHQLKQSVILKVLHLLGWDAFNISEIVADFQAGGMTIDFVLHTPEQGSIFLSVMKPLNDKSMEFQEKVIKTAAASNSHIAVFTDGLEWRLFVTQNHASMYDKEFVIVNFSEGEPEEHSATLKRYLSKRLAFSGTAFVRADKMFQDRIKRKQKLFSSALHETWAQILSEIQTLFVELLLIEIKRLNGTTRIKSDVEQYYVAFAATAATPELQKKVKYDTLDAEIHRAITSLLQQLLPLLTELIISDIERKHHFHADEDAIRTFLTAVVTTHEAAVEKGRTRKQPV